MNRFLQLKQILKITRSHGILRRYFVVNGFDGALTILGLVTGFYVSDEAEVTVIITACLGAAIALGISGVSSAYISESAERKKELLELEQAMIADLGETAHGKGARLAPIIIAMVNGAAPLLLSLIIILPLWLEYLGFFLPVGSLPLTIFFAFVIIFFLGVFLGRVSQTFWLWSGIRTLLIALVTSLVILSLARL